MRRFITYAVHDEGFIVSRVGNELAWPVLDFGGIGMGGTERSTGKAFEKGNFTGPTNYDLEKVQVHSCREWRSLRWTKKIPTVNKNEHRVFWGMKPLPVGEPWFVYILRCAGKRGGTLYTGATSDVGRRVREHQEGKGAKYTRSHLPVELVLSVKVPSKSDALALEAEIKCMPRARKDALVAGFKEAGGLNP